MSLTYLMKAEVKILHDAGSLGKLWLIDLSNILCLHEGQSLLWVMETDPDCEELHETPATYVHAARTSDPCPNRK